VKTYSRPLEDFWGGESRAPSWTLWTLSARLKTYVRSFEGFLPVISVSLKTYVRPFPDQKPQNLILTLYFLVRALRPWEDLCDTPLVLNGGLFLSFVMPIHAPAKRICSIANVLQVCYAYTRAREDLFPTLLSLKTAKP
jgi:hypothetical protein